MTPKPDPIDLARLYGLAASGYLAPYDAIARALRTGILNEDARPVLRDYLDVATADEILGFVASGQSSPTCLRLLAVEILPAGHENRALLDRLDARNARG